MKKLLLGIIAVLMSCFALNTSVSFAAPVWVSGVTVSYAGTYYDDTSQSAKVLVRVEYSNGAAQHLQAVAGSEKEILATALTAATSGKPVKIWIDRAENGAGDQGLSKGQIENPLPLHGIVLMNN